MAIPVGLQLWTVKQDTARDLPAALKAVADVGYQGVELWFADWPPADELKGILDECGLKAIGAHHVLPKLRDEFDAIAEYLKVVGCTDVAIAMVPEELRPDEDGWKRCAGEIAALGERCNAAGLRLSYHNHAYELEERVGETSAHEFLFASIPADLLKVQLDTCFVKAVGEDPAAYIRRYAGRLPLLHLKDFAPPPAPGGSTELGRGQVDFDSVLAAAPEAGVEWYIVEQTCSGSGLDSIRTSYGFLKSRGVV